MEIAAGLKTRRLVGQNPSKNCTLPDHNSNRPPIVEIDLEFHRPDRPYRPSLDGMDGLRDLLANQSQSSAPFTCSDSTPFLGGQSGFLRLRQVNSSSFGERGGTYNNFQSHGALNQHRGAGCTLLGLIHLDDHDSLINQSDHPQFFPRSLIKTRCPVLGDQKGS
jgi:hypothetical protein